MNQKKPAPAANPKQNPSANPSLAAGSKQVGENVCPNCNKTFTKDRIAKHIEICKPRGTRPIFDAGKHRTQGTQAEKYYKRRGGA